MFVRTFSHTPSGAEHKKTDEHDHGVLDQTPSTTKPVTEDTDENLTDDDTDNFKVRNGADPCFLTNGIIVPTRRECCFEQWSDVSNGKEHVTGAVLVVKFSRDKA